MTCERCGGFMVFDAFCYPQEKEPPTATGTIRCLNCGNSRAEASHFDGTHPKELNMSIAQLSL
jgi:hypothetical protein